MPSLPAIRCPLCALPLAQSPAVWQCPNRHSFDVAREGYVNLLPVQQKASLQPGDTADSLKARRAFLDAEHYAPLREALRARLMPLAAQRLLDIGCGEGWYTASFAAFAPAVIGLDIAKPAIRMAARAHARHQPGITWLVGSGARLPVDDASIDLVTCLFTPLHGAEIQRVLAPGGHLAVVTPGAAHLAELRAGLFDEVVAHQPEKFVDELQSRFRLVARDDVLAPLQLDNTALRQLLAMTPYAWKARPERRASLEAQAGLVTTAAFTILLFETEPAA